VNLRDFLYTLHRKPSFLDDLLQYFGHKFLITYPYQSLVIAIKKIWFLADSPRRRVVELIMGYSTHAARS